MGNWGYLSRVSSYLYFCSFFLVYESITVNLAVSVSVFFVSFSIFG